ncbi:two-component sensor histidine kinase, partial [Campylobacter coli]|nr:two-component sensor histidine kinase [Campylobacter coli]
AVAAGLRRRAPDDATPLDARQVPTEVRPLVDALNALFARINALLVRERRFTSDAAHELRSPLAALRVQTEVVQLAGEDAPMREH